MGRFGLLHEAGKVTDHTRSATAARAAAFPLKNYANIRVSP